MNKISSIQKAILKVFVDTPLSASDIAKQIDFPQDKIYYHIKKLEAQKKIYVADTEIINGITKKKFLPMENEIESVLPPPKTMPENQAKALKNDDADELKEQKQKDHQLDDSSSDIVSQVSTPSPQGPQAGTDSNVESSLIENLMKHSKGSPTPLYNQSISTDEEIEREIEREIEEITINDETYLVPKGGLDYEELEYRVKAAKKKSGEAMTIGENNIVKEHLLRTRANIVDEEIAETEEETEEETEAAPQEKKIKKKRKTLFFHTQWLNLYRVLNGYSKTVTFVHHGNKVAFLHATVKPKGFRIHHKQTYTLPYSSGEKNYNTLTELISYVLSERFKTSQRKRLYVAIYSSEYNFEIDFMKVPKLKAKELHNYILMKISKEFVVKPDNLIVNWKLSRASDKKDAMQNAICFITDKEPMVRDTDILSNQGIPFRYTTSIVKLQYDQFFYNHGEETDGNALLLYIGEAFSRITLVSDWKIIESRKTPLGLDDFIDLYLKLQQNEAEINFETAREHILNNPIFEEGNTLLETVYDKLIAEIELTLSHFKRKKLIISENVFISGIASIIPGMIERISTSLELTIKRMNIPKSMDKKQNEGLEEYYDNIGLLLDPKDQLNLLPYRHRQNFKFFFPTKLMEIVLAGILVVFAAVVSVQYNAFISIKGPVAEKEYLVKSALMERDTFFKFFAEAEALKALARAQEQDKFAAEKTVYFLKMLSKTIPKNVKIYSLELTGEQDAVLNGEIMYNGSNPDLELNNLSNALKDNKYIMDAQLLSSNNKTESLFTFEMILHL